MQKWRIKFLFVSSLLLLYVALLPFNSINAQTPLSPFPDVTVPIDIPENQFPKLDSMLNKLLISQDFTYPSEIFPVPAIQSHGASFATSYTGSNVLVNIFINRENNTIQSFISQSGGSIAHMYSDLIEAYVPSNALPTLSGFDDVRFIELATYPISNVVSEGANTHNVPLWHTHGYTGKDIKVGIIDIGFIGIKDLQGNELPSTISAMCFIIAGVSTNNIDFCDVTTTHGADVSEAVLDIAPGVNLYIAKPITQGDMKEATEWMISQGVQVINMSLAFAWTGQGNGLSTISSSTLNSVSLAVQNGIVFVNSAGNQEKQNWNGSWNDTGVSGDPDNLHNFNCGGNSELLIFESISIGKVMDFRLRWEDDWLSPSTDLDLYLYYWNGSNWIIVDSSTTKQIANGSNPKERIAYTALESGNFALAVLKYSGVIPDSLQITAMKGKNLFYEACEVGGSIAEPGDSPSNGLVTVGAANWQTPTTIAAYSSQGPTFDGRVKPDIVSVDNANSSNGPWKGTSQASPHVAGLTALFLEFQPSYSPAQIKNYLISNAIGQGTVPNNTWGYGLAHLGNLPPTAPSNVSASAGFEQATVGFDPPSSNGGSSITSYTIATNPPHAEKIIIAGGAPSGTITGLNGGIPYTFRIKATNSVGDSPFSAYSSSVTPSGSAKKLAFTTQPGNGSAGALLSPQPIVAIQDMGGNTKTSASNPVAISITSGTGKSGATLQGTTTITPVNGIATFTNLRIDNASSGYTFTASTSGLQSATSSQFTVSGATATSMSFSSFPPHGIMNQLFSPQPIVLLTDPFGNSASNTGTVSIAIVSGTGGPTSNLLGTKTVNIADGFATFTDLKIDTSSRDYKLIASSSGLTSITSLPFTVWIETVGPVMNVWGIGIIGTFILVTLFYLSNKRNIKQLVFKKSKSV